MRRAPKGPIITQSNTLAVITLTPRAEGDDKTRLEKASKKIMSEIYCRGVTWASCKIIVRFPDKPYCFHKPAGDAGQLTKQACTYAGAEVLFN